VISELALIPTKKKLANRTIERLAEYVPFKHPFEFIETCHLVKIKKDFSKCFPDVFYIGVHVANNLD
jgi:hypothetical protein